MPKATQPKSRRLLRLLFVWLDELPAASEWELMLLVTAIDIGCRLKADIKTLFTWPDRQQPKTLLSLNAPGPGKANLQS